VKGAGVRRVAVGGSKVYGHREVHLHPEEKDTG
jgi:hypothetical protein